MQGSIHTGDIFSMQEQDISSIPIQLVSQCLVASIQVDLTGGVLERFRSHLLAALQRTNATGVVLDVSGVEVMDLAEFDALRQTMQMADLMGARSVFSGFRPGVVSSLVELDADVCSVEASANLDAALALLVVPEAVEEDGDGAGDESDGAAVRNAQEPESADIEA